MYRIASFGTNASKPTRPADITTPGYFVTGTQVDFGWLNTMQESIARAVELSGLTLDPDDDEQLYKAIKTLGGYGCRAVPLGAGASTYVIAGSGIDVNQKGNLTQVVRTSSVDCSIQVAWALPVDIRGLQVADFEFRVKPVTAFTGTGITVTAFLYKIHTDGSVTSLGSLALNALATGSWLFKNASNFGVSPLVLAVQEGLYLQLDVAVTGGGAGEFHFQQFSLLEGPA